jgi:hypothetical protein
VFPKAKANKQQQYNVINYYALLRNVKREISVERETWETASFFTLFFLLLQQKIR